MYFNYNKKRKGGNLFIRFIWSFVHDTECDTQQNGLKKTKAKIVFSHE